MPRPTIPALAFLLLASCGADAPPVPLSEAPPRAGRDAGTDVSISGSASLGVVRRPGG